MKASSPVIQGLEFSQLCVTTASPLTSLSVVWGFLSTFDAEILGMNVSPCEAFIAVENMMGRAVDEHGKVKMLLCELILNSLLSMDLRCQSICFRVQCTKTIALWTSQIL